MIVEVLQLPPFRLIAAKENLLMVLLFALRRTLAEFPDISKLVNSKIVIYEFTEISILWK